jgi:hypothetical protein
MSRLVSLFPRLALALLCLGPAAATTAQAAGSVEMQVEHLVKQAMEEYNAAMETGDSASFVKYFDAEFKAYKATYQIKKMLVQGNSAAIVFTWDAVDRKTGDFVKIDMVGLYEVGSSGQFSSATYYFDSAKAKALADLGR